MVKSDFFALQTVDLLKSPSGSNCSRRLPANWTLLLLNKPFRETLCMHNVLTLLYKTKPLCRFNYVYQTNRTHVF